METIEHADAPTVRVFRPKHVAAFLRRLPVDARHDALNALALLGLDAFASSGLFNHDAWQSMQVSGERVVSNLKMLAREVEPHINAHYRSLAPSSAGSARGGSGSAGRELDDILGDDLGEGGALVSPARQVRERSAKVQAALRTESRTVSPPPPPSHVTSPLLPPPATSVAMLEPLVPVGGRPSPRREGRKFISPPGAGTARTASVSSRLESTVAELVRGGGIVSSEEQRGREGSAGQGKRSQSIEFSRISPPPQGRGGGAAAANPLLLKRRAPPVISGAPRMTTSYAHNSSTMRPVKHNHYYVNPVSWMPPEPRRRAEQADGGQTEPGTSFAAPTASAQSRAQQQQQRSPSRSPKQQRQEQAYGNAQVYGMAARMRSEAEALLNAARRFETTGDRSIVRSPQRRGNAVQLRQFIHAQRERLQQQRELGNDPDATLVKAPVATPVNVPGAAAAVAVAAIHSNASSRRSSSSTQHSRVGSQRQLLVAPGTLLPSDPPPLGGTETGLPAAVDTTGVMAGSSNNLATMAPGGFASSNSLDGAGNSTNNNNNNGMAMSSNSALPNTSFASSSQPDLGNVTPQRGKLQRQRKVALVLGVNANGEIEAAQEVAMPPPPIETEDELDEDLRLAESIRAAGATSSSLLGGTAGSVSRAMRSSGRINSFVSEDEDPSPLGLLSPARRVTALDMVFDSAWGAPPTSPPMYAASSSGLMINGQASLRLPGAQQMQGGGGKLVSPARRRGNSVLLEASTGDMRLLPAHHLYERSPSDDANGAL